MQPLNWCCSLLILGFVNLPTLLINAAPTLDLPLARKPSDEPAHKLVTRADSLCPATPDGQLESTYIAVLDSEEGCYKYGVRKSDGSLDLEGFVLLGDGLGQGGQGTLFEATTVHNMEGEIIAEGVAKLSDGTNGNEAAKNIERLNLPNHVVEVKKRMIVDLVASKMDDKLVKEQSLVVFEDLEMDAWKMIWLSLQGRMSFDEKVMIKELLEGLVKLHKKELAHMDVKPANFMLRKQSPSDSNHRKYKLIDFDMAVDTKSSEVPGRWGTRGFRAPEVQNEELENNDQLHKADCFSAAMTQLLIERSQDMLGSTCYAKDDPQAYQYEPFLRLDRCILHFERLWVDLVTPKQSERPGGSGKSRDEVVDILPNYTKLADAELERYSKLLCKVSERIDMETYLKELGG